MSTGTEDVRCWMDTAEDTHEKTLHISFPDLTVFWAKVKSKRQIEEVLKLVLTYDPGVQSK